MVGWEVIHKASVFIAEEMGVALKRSAFSPNIRERMDHSCAIVDRSGRIVAQAEHIPVHLGSFRVGVENTLKWIEREGVELFEGDVIILNDPYIAGTHLNDVMVLTPIFYRGKLAGYAVNKAHHVDVGGPQPGSINPSARSIYEEGVIVPPVKLYSRGELARDVLRFFVENSKTPRITLGDLNAQIAANSMGVSRVRELFDRYGLKKVLEGWESSIEYARRSVAMELSSWPQGVYEAVDYLEWGDDLLDIRVRLEIRGSGIHIDFTGSSPQVEAPLNAVFGVTFSACSFSVRSVIGGDIPTNEGFYSAIDVHAPQGSIVNPVKPAPVSGGNLETSQRIADAVLLALAKAIPHRVPAQGSGTMMNVMMGGIDSQGSYWAYYETIGGGSGARPNGDGVSGVHVNMTNTLNTPIEIAERSYPILFSEYRIRYGSGGSGRFRGGDGIVRSFKALSRLRLSILADRFRIGPRGLAGGGSGATGSVTIVKRDGSRISMPSKFTIDLDPGDLVVIETPGGGGYGSTS